MTERVKQVVTILLVEDNEMNRDMLARRLKRRGYEVHLAIDGEQAIELTLAEQPDVILMDVNLPGMDGWETTRQLKSMPTTQQVPVLALTAHAMTEDRQRAVDAGCDDYDTKPVDFTRLVDKILALIDRTKV